MRPLELHLEGFTSFRERTVLDFSDLSLFAITGPNGAGKSSLLDAITFALYGSTARSGGNEFASLMSQGSERMKVSFRFTASGKEYRVTRTRSNKGSGSTFQLDEYQDQGWQTLETKEKSVTQKVEQILKMDYATFIRVILLPQGSFDQFLKGKGNERREMLRQLSGIEIYEQMHKKAAERFKSLIKELNSLGNELGSTTIPTETEIADQENRLTYLQQLLPDLRQKTEQSQAQARAAETLLKNLKTLSTHQEQLEEITSRSSSIEECRQRLQQAQAADRIKTEWQLVQEARHQIQQVEEQIKQAQEHVQNTQAQFDTAQAHQQALQNQEATFATRRQQLEEASQYEQRRSEQENQLQQEQSKQQEIQESLDLQKVTLDQLTQTLLTHQQNLEAVTQEVEQTFPGGGDRLVQLQQVTPLLAEFSWQHNQLQGQLAEQDQLQHRLPELEQLLQTTQNDLEKKEAAYLSAQSKLQQAQATQSAAGIRPTLHAGDPCPVCNNIYPGEESLPPFPPSQLPALQSVETQTSQERNAALAQQTRAELELANTQSTLHHLQQKCQTAQGKLSELQQQIQVQLQEATWDPQRWELEKAQLQQRENLYQDAVSRQKEITTQHKEIQLIHTYQQKTSQRLEADLQAQQSTQEHLQQQLQITLEHLKTLLSDQPYTQLKEIFEQKEKTWKDAIASSTQHLKQCEAGHYTAVAQLDQAQKISQNAQRNLYQREQEWLQAFNSQQMTEVIFLECQASADQQDDWQKRIQTYDNETSQIILRIDSLKQQIGNQTTTPETISLLKTEAEKLQKQIDATNMESGQLQERIQNDKEKLAKKQDSLKKREKLQAEEQIYSQLARDLKSTNFQTYLLDILQSDLVIQANRILQDLSEERYVLKLDQGEFWVEDNWNGGEARSVKTLSGGETFATSLSMALALSEKLAGGAEVGCLFLDEGFGSLDQNTLDGVTQTLMSLQQQDRLVGIISHVTSLAEQMPAQIRVEKSTYGSRLTKMSST
jgi:exonuclease SbcC